MRLICGHSDKSYTVLTTALDYVSRDKFEIIRCDHCQLTQTKIDLSKVNIGEYYPSSYHGKEQRYNFILSFITKFLIRQRIKLIRKYLPESANILDIGCGQGWLLHELKSKGHQVQGVEYNSQAAYHAKHQLNLDILEGDVRELNFKKNNYDCVIIWHVLEHVANPEELLNYVRGLLKPSGTLLVAVPNHGSIESRLTGRYWFHLDAPRHLSHFTKAKLEKVFDDQNFEPIAMHSFVPEYDFFSFIQSVLNRLGLQQNGLYAFLRRSPDGVLIRGKLKKVDLFLSFVLFPWLFIASLLWVPVVSFFNNGATISYILKKI